MFARTSLSSSGSGHPGLGEGLGAQNESHRSELHTVRAIARVRRPGGHERTRTRGSVFNMSYSHAESPEAYATRLGLWLKDFGFDQTYRNRRIFFLHLVHELTCCM